MAYYYLQQWCVLPSIAETLHSDDAPSQAGLRPLLPIPVYQAYLPISRFTYQQNFLQNFGNPALHQFSQLNQYNTVAMGDLRHSTRADRAEEEMEGKSTEGRDERLSMAGLSEALPDPSVSRNYGQNYPPSDSAQLPTQPQFAGQTQPNLQAQYGYQGQVPNYGYHRAAPGPIQTQYQGQNMYNGQQSMYFQQYGPSGQYYQGSPRIGENLVGHGYQGNLSSPTWSQFSGERFSPQIQPQRSIPSVPRGPPRKPKQSGHALWVGNLPPGALVNDLKDHFSRDATSEIESVFLISKSNCAFVNYKTEEACAAAMARFHDSRFAGVRLVCRLRRTSANPGGATTGIPTAPAALASSAAAAEGQTAIEAVTRNREESIKAEEASRLVAGADKINEKYFIVKSLTIEDLELSTRNGIWATQAHNEEALNKAFESVENVYLIFSVNKSGEYFGYARMTSPINEESAATLDWKPRAEAPVSDDPDVPRSIPTPATETAPKGRIIDDSARGTIFWEAESDSDEEAVPEPANEDATVTSTELETIGSPRQDTKEEPPSQQPYGHPFQIQWISTARLPFYRTRGLRNPWNSNREVKIARDGTELETGVGRRLLSMFASMGSTASSGNASILGGQRLGPGGMSGGFQSPYAQQQQHQQQLFQGHQQSFHAQPQFPPQQYQGR